MQEVGVFLPCLHLVELRELATEQHLVAAGDVDEHLGDARAQRGLLLRDTQGDLVDRVERLGQATDLVAALHGDRLDDDAWAFSRCLHPLDHARELLADLSRRQG